MIITITTPRTYINSKHHRISIIIITLFCCIRAGPRTGDGIFPGDVVEVVQTLRDREQTYLRLAGDRGWLFQYHPKGNFALMYEVIADKDDEDDTWSLYDVE